MKSLAAKSILFCPRLTVGTQSEYKTVGVDFLGEESPPQDLLVKHNIIMCMYATTAAFCSCLASLPLLVLAP